MKKYAIILLALTLLIPSAAQAQRKKRGRKPAVTEDPRIQQMLASTQQIVFIDSMVVGKRDFLRHIPLSPECGKLEMNDSLCQFTNELKDHRLAAYFDTTDSLCHIGTSDYIGNAWTPQQRAEGIAPADANYPYLMPDGITLYYAQKGEKSIGGYDIFVTRYDNDSGTFLRAENLGMPFSSTANDYLYAIDETHNLGYFVTDRRQPKDTVCIYVFVPNEKRKVYQSEAYSNEQLRSLAAISRIADTWTDKAVCQQAQARLKQARQKPQAAGGIKQQASELDNLHHQAEVLEKALLLARNYYAKASVADRQTLRSEILKSERELETLQLEIRQKEKEERNRNTHTN